MHTRIEDFPMPGNTRFLKDVITNPKIVVGEYTYSHHEEGVYVFQDNVLYLFDFMSTQLIIGKFCAIAKGVRLIMDGANHPMGGISTYPFLIFGLTDSPMEVQPKGDTIVGNDVWIGDSATIMPGVKIGDGAIVGACSVVTKDVPPYTIVAGNPAKIIRKRFDDETITSLLELKWWDWPIDKIKENVIHLNSADLPGSIKILKSQS